MKVTLFFCFVIVTDILASEQCKYRKNYISYKVHGQHDVDGINSAVVLITLQDAFRLWERTIDELWFTPEDGIYQENFELAVRFVSFGEKFKSEKWYDLISYSANNCSSSLYNPDEEIFTIHNSTIWFNTDYTYNVPPRSPGHHHHHGVNFFMFAVHEIGHVLGLHSNNNPESLMFHTEREGFRTTKNLLVEIPDCDRQTINQLYPLKTKN